MCDLMGAMPAPPPTNTISAFVSFAKNSPKGPKTLTLSPGFKPNVQEDIRPGGTSEPGGGEAILILNLIIPFSSG